MRSFAKGILATALGMNVVALGMKANDSDHAGNLAWDIVSLYLTLQLWIFCVAALTAFTLIISKFAFNEKKEKQNEDIASQRYIVQHEETSNAAAQNIPPSKKIHKVVTQKPPDPPRELSKDDLRKRVLRELTGRSDI